MFRRINEVKNQRIASLKSALQGLTHQQIKEIVFSMRVRVNLE